MNELLKDHACKTFRKQKGRKLTLQDLNNICQFQCESNKKKEKKKKDFWKKIALCKFKVINWMVLTNKHKREANPAAISTNYEPLIITRYLTTLSQLSPMKQV